MADGVEVLQEAIRGMSENVAHMRVAVDKMSEELKKIAVLEAKHNGHDAAIERAFIEIKDIEKQLLEHTKVDSREHDSFKKAIWFTTGFAMAVSALWTVFGIYLGDSMRETLKAVGEMKMHSADKSVHFHEVPSAVIGGK